MNTKTKNITVTCIMAGFFLILSAWAWFKPADDFSDSERRNLAKFPSLTWANIMSGDFMTDFESYTLDQFPLRDDFRTLKSIAAFYVFNQSDNNDIYVENGYASKMEYPLNEESITRAAERFKNVYDKFLADKDINVYFTIVPDKNYFLAGQNGYLAMDYDEFYKQMTEQTEFMEYIDIRRLLDVEDYYRTDTHWRQEALIDVAKKIADSMGVTLNAEYEEKLLDNPFYGVYYGQSALPLEAEQIKYLTNDILENCVVYDWQNSKNISIYDMEKAYGKDPYEMYLSGSLSLITIENPAATTDKELIIFRDSFGSSIAPLFVEGYSKVTLVDIRYIMPDMLGRYIEFDNQDVLFLYSTLVLNNSETIK